MDSRILNLKGAKKKPRFFGSPPLNTTSYPKNLNIFVEIRKTSCRISLSIGSLPASRFTHTLSRTTKDADLPIEARNPILFPKNTEITRLIIRHRHDRGFHSGVTIRALPGKQETKAYICLYVPLLVLYI